MNNVLEEFNQSTVFNDTFFEAVYQACLEDNNLTKAFLDKAEAIGRYDMFNKAYDSFLIRKSINEIEKPGKKKKSLHYSTAKELLEADLPPTEYIVDVIIAKGLVVLSAKSKIGKSWLALQLALSVTSGNDFLGFNTTQGGVLYIDLENTAALTQARLIKLLDGAAPPDNLIITNDYSTMNDTFMEDLAEYLEANKNISLVIVDVFQKIKKAKKANQSDYEDIYNSFVPLKELADKYNISLMLIMHNRKMTDTTDPFSNVFGSTAIMGASDEMMVIHKKERKDAEATLSITGRTVSGGDYAIRFNAPICKWEMIGNAEEVQEKRNREEYENTPVIKAVKRLVDKGGGTYSGTITEIISASKYMQGCAIYQSPQKCGRDLKKYSKKLADYDAIIHTDGGHGTAAGKHKFEKVFV